MPRFFFDVAESGSSLTDSSGLDLPDLESARLEAERTARELIQHQEAGQRFSVDVRDGAESPPVIRLSIALRDDTDWLLSRYFC